MARLTTFSRLMITLVIIAAVFFGVRYFFPNIGKSDPAQTEQNANGSTADRPAEMEDKPTSTASDWGGSKSTSGTTSAAFSYSPAQPVNGKLKGVVEMGATGFNSFIINMDAQKNWKLEKADFGTSLVYEKLASEEDIKNGLKAYIANMLAYGVGPKDIHFVVSSGARKVDVTSKISALLKGMGYYVNEVTPELEAKLALKSVLPREYNGKAFVVDIGSGNTKISWLPNGAIEASGAKYFQNNVDDATVYNEVKGKASQVPSNLRGTCFIIGGVPYELAKQNRSGKERYTVLKAPAGYTADGAKQKSGLNIYKAIADGTGCQQFVFDWDANFTIGFLLNL